MTPPNAATAGYPHLSPNMPVGILQTEKKGQARRRNWGKAACLQKRSDRPICTYEGTSEQTDYGNQRSGEEGETC